MKNGLLFLVCATLLILLAFRFGGLAWLCLWPAISFAIVAIGYLKSGASVFGKRNDGTIGAVQLVLLFPFLVYTWTVWHIVRSLSTESPRHELTPGFWIGRRLLARELPDNVDVVVDLTCEFHEPQFIRSTRQYVACPILDAGVPSVAALRHVVDVICAQEGIVYLHCAQGHGRTGLVAAAVLLQKRLAVSSDSAIEMIRSRRPGMRLNHVQRAALSEFELK